MKVLAEKLVLELEPASKVIHHLRDLFPDSFLVGWKYELDGTRADALKKAQRQLAECRTDACVVNGRAYGTGFGYCTPDGQLRHLADKHVLADHLAKRCAGCALFPDTILPLQPASLAAKAAKPEA